MKSEGVTFSQVFLKISVNINRSCKSCSLKLLFNLQMLQLKFCTHFPSVTCMLRVRSISLPWFKRPNYMQWLLQIIMKALVILTSIILSANDGKCNLEALQQMALTIPLTSNTSFSLGLIFSSLLSFRTLLVCIILLQRDVHFHTSVKEHTNICPAF